MTLHHEFPNRLHGILELLQHVKRFSQDGVRDTIANHSVLPISNGVIDRLEYIAKIRAKQQTIWADSWGIRDPAWKSHGGVHVIVYTSWL